MNTLTLFSYLCGFIAGFLYAMSYTITSKLSLPIITLTTTIRIILTGISLYFVLNSSPIHSILILVFFSVPFLIRPNSQKN